jgi:hypothetical protein
VKKFLILPSRFSGTNLPVNLVVEEVENLSKTVPSA